MKGINMIYVKLSANYLPRDWCTECMGSLLCGAVGTVLGTPTHGAPGRQRRAVRVDSSCLRDGETWR